MIAKEALGGKSDLPDRASEVRALSQLVRGQLATQRPLLSGDTREFGLQVSATGQFAK